MKSLMSLFSVMLKDLSIMCNVDATRDGLTASRRFEHEGDAFFGITLANLGKELERALEQGHWSGSPAFQNRAGTSLPQFLGGFFQNVFDGNTGKLLDTPDTASIYAIRQLTLSWCKIKEPCTESRNSKALRDYVKCESEVKSWTKGYRYDTELRSSFKRIAKILFQDLFQELDEDVFYGRLRPSHGPGATADAVYGNAKWQIRSWTSRLEKVFPSGDYLLPNYRYWKNLQVVDFREPGREMPVKVTLVPKTMKTPRIIAQEPSWQMFCQKALQQAWYDKVDSGRVISGQFHCFERQEPNRELARMGSLDRSLSTLDLSEASDRVSIALVADMLSDFPHLKEAVFACRSTKSQLPTGDEFRLWKFASMGSALCFPVEAAVFLTAVFFGIEQELSKPLSSKTVSRFFGRVHVYGDDIIVPTDFVASVTAALELFGFKVNTQKSFDRGYFRESCGAEYYMGEDVSILKLRSRLPRNRQDVREISSLSAYRNLAYKRGLWHLASHCDEVLEKILKYYPAVADTSPVIGRFAFTGYDQEKESASRHSPLVKGWVRRDPLPESILSGVEALHKILLQEDSSVLGERHLERAGRPKSATLSLRWTQPF